MSGASPLDRLAAGRTDLAFELAKNLTPRTDPGIAADIIRWCAYYGDVSAIRFLLLKGWNLDMLGSNFDLAGAAFHGQWRLCEFLVERGADARFADPTSGETPLHLAASKANSLPHEAAIMALLSAGADPNARALSGAETGAFMRDCRTRGETPLHRAAAFSTQTAVVALIEAGAGREAKDAFGETALSWASWHLRPSSILRILAYGPYNLHPAADWSGDHGSGASGMDRNLLGRPRG